MTAPSSPLRLMTLNIWFSEHYLARRMRAIGDLLERHSPHVVALQEMTEHDHPGKKAESKSLYKTTTDALKTLHEVQNLVLMAARLAERMHRLWDWTHPWKTRLMLIGMLRRLLAASEMISPKIFPVTIVSNCFGSRITCIAQLSMYMCDKSTSL